MKSENSFYAIVGGLIIIVAVLIFHSSKKQTHTDDSSSALSPVTDSRSNSAVVKAPPRVPSSVPSINKNRKSGYLTDSQIAYLNPILKEYGMGVKNMSRAEMINSLDEQYKNKDLVNAFLETAPKGNIITTFNSDPSAPFKHFKALQVSCPALDKLQGQVALKVSGNQIAGGVYTMTGEPLDIDVSTCLVYDPHNQYPDGFNTVYTPPYNEPDAH